MGNDATGIGDDYIRKRERQRLLHGRGVPTPLAALEVGHKVRFGWESRTKTLVADVDQPATISHDDGRFTYRVVLRARSESYALAASRPVVTDHWSEIELTRSKWRRPRRPSFLAILDDRGEPDRYLIHSENYPGRADSEDS